MQQRCRQKAVHKSIGRGLVAKNNDAAVCHILTLSKNENASKRHYFHILMLTACGFKTFLQKMMEDTKKPVPILSERRQRYHQYPSLFMGRDSKSPRLVWL